MADLYCSGYAAWFVRPSGVVRIHETGWVSRLKWMKRWGYFNTSLRSMPVL